MVLLFLESINLLLLLWKSMRHQQHQGLGFLLLLNEAELVFPRLGSGDHSQLNTRKRFVNKANSWSSSQTHWKKMVFKGRTQKPAQKFLNLQWGHGPVNPLSQWKYCRLATTHRALRCSTPQTSSCVAWQGTTLSAVELHPALPEWVNSAPGKNSRSDFSECYHFHITGKSRRPS